MWDCLACAFARRRRHPPRRHPVEIRRRRPQAELFETARDPREVRLHAALDEIRDRYGHAAVVAGASIRLLGKLPQDSRGFVLRTPSLTK